MTTKLPESALQELQALSPDELQEILDFNRFLRAATGFRSALDSTVELMLSGHEARRREHLRRYSLQPVSCLTPLPQA